MPKIKSAQKALRQNSSRRKRNVATKEKYKKIVKTYQKLVAAKKIDEAKTLISQVYKTLDKAARSGVIKKNKASRLKSNAAKILSKQ